MAKLITVYWRDIPAQVIAKQGRASVKKELHKRFAEAIDRAAMRAGRGSSSAYLEGWRRESRETSAEESDQLEQTVEQQVTSLEQAFPEDYLKRVTKAGGRQPEAEPVN